MIKGKHTALGQTKEIHVHVNVDDHQIMLLQTILSGQDAMGRLPFYCRSAISILWLQFIRVVYNVIFAHLYQ